jgi:signal transduction histidine kinase
MIIRTGYVRCKAFLHFPTQTSQRHFVPTATFSHNFFIFAIFLIPKPLPFLDGRNLNIGQLLWGVERLLRTDRVCAIAAAAAHGLNNELTVILNSVSNSLPTLEPGHPARPDLLDLHLAALRCAQIASDLLEFSARNGARPARAPLDHLVRVL